MAELTDNERKAPNEREQTLFRAMKRHFGGCPGDWTGRAMADGISSFLDWRDWLAGGHVSMELLDAVLADLAATWTEAHKYPAIRLVQARYRAKQRHAPTDAPRAECVCRGSGIIIIATVYQGNVTYPVHPDHPVPAPIAHVHRDAVTLTSYPCRCSVGDKVTAGWWAKGSEPSANDRAELFKYRLPSPRAGYKLIRDCARLAGDALPEKPGTDTPADGMDTLRFTKRLAAVSAAAEQDRHARLDRGANEYPDVYDDWKSRQGGTVAVAEI